MGENLLDLRLSGCSSSAKRCNRERVSLETHRVRVVLETNDEVVGVAHDDDVAARVPLSPSMNPDVEDAVQVDVRQQRRNHAYHAIDNSRRRSAAGRSRPDGPAPFVGVGYDLGLAPRVTSTDIDLVVAHRECDRRGEYDREQWVAHSAARNV